MAAFLENPDWWMIIDAECFLRDQMLKFLIGSCGCWFRILCRPGRNNQRTDAKRTLKHATSSKPRLPSNNLIIRYGHRVRQWNSADTPCPADRQDQVIGFIECISSIFFSSLSLSTWLVIPLYNWPKDRIHQKRQTFIPIHWRSRFSAAWVPILNAGSPNE